MKKKLTVIIFILIIVLLYFNTVSAYNLELILSADKTDVKVGDTVTVTLTLSRGMQAADFALNYDNNLLKFENASLNQNFYSTKEQGKIICSWFNTQDTTKFTFTFTAISSGTATFSTTTENFYDGNLQSASSYDEGVLNVTLLSSAAINVGATQNQTINTTQNITNITQNSNQEEIKQANSNKSENNVNQSINNEEFASQTDSSTYKTYLSNTNTVSTSSNVSLPQTGNNSTLFICMAFGVAILAIVSKIKLTKLRDI